MSFIICSLFSFLIWFHYYPHLVGSPYSICMILLHFFFWETGFLFFIMFVTFLFWSSTFSVSLTTSQLVRDIDFTNNVCPACHKAFNRKAHVHRHYVELHMGHAEWACSNCNKKFKRRYQMEHHARTCYRKRGNLNEHQCWSCMTVYPNEAKLIDHMEKAHSLSLFNWYSREYCLRPVGIDENSDYNINWKLWPFRLFFLVKFEI